MNKRIYTIIGIACLVAAFCGILYLFHLNKLEADRLQAELDKLKGDHDELSDRLQQVEAVLEKSKPRAAVMNIVPLADKPGKTPPVTPPKRTVTPTTKTTQKPAEKPAENKA